MDPRDIPYDSDVRRYLLDRNQEGRDNVMRQNPDFIRVLPEYRPGVDNIQRGAINWVTERAQALQGNRRVAYFRNNPYIAYHFPHLDPRNVNPRRRGPILPLHRFIEIDFINTWPDNLREREFWARPWLRHRYPELAPPGGWPPRLFLPFANSPFTVVQGPPELYQNWPIRDPRYDPEPCNFVQSALRQLPPRVRTRTNLPLVERRYRDRYERTPPPEIYGRPYPRRAPTGQNPDHFRMTAAQYFDPTRYRRGDRPHGYIDGAPPYPYHDFLPQGVPVEDVPEAIYREGYAIPPNDPRDEVDFRRPQSRDYPNRGPFDPVWDDNFIPAEYRLGLPQPR